RGGNPQAAVQGDVCQWMGRERRRKKIPVHGRRHGDAAVPVQRSPELDVDVEEIIVAPDSTTTTGEVERFGQVGGNNCWSHSTKVLPDGAAFNVDAVAVTAETRRSTSRRRAGISAVAQGTVGNASRPAATRSRTTLPSSGRGRKTEYGQVHGGLEKF